MSDDYSKNINFLPMNTPKGECCIHDYADVGDRNEFMNYSLPKGKYDIDYVIIMLRIIHDKIESMKMRPKDIPFTMCNSMKKLIAMLEIEKSQNE